MYGQKRKAWSFVKSLSPECTEVLLLVVFYGCSLHFAYQSL
jgi:hypothetical protein